MKSNITVWSRILLTISALSLAASIFVPIWQIDLQAPQYPEGLGLKIWADKLGGDVDIINGLNHYIGMKTLHEHDFVEFSVLRYIIGFYAIFALLAAVLGKRKVLYALFTMFVLFGVVAMIDFWRWEYNYGHNLDPHAAIIVPGMAYQPPLIGFKQLLNFGAYSVPDTGGWLFVVSGGLMLLAVIMEVRRVKKAKKIGQTQSHGATAAVMVLMTLLLSSCGNKGPEAIKLNSDSCDYCKMTISDERFCCELLTEKGRVYKFDDVKCMMGYKKENGDKMNKAKYYVCDYIKPHTMTEADKLSYVHSESLESPMGGNTGGYTKKDSAMAYKNKYSGEEMTWSAINQ